MRPIREQVKYDGIRQQPRTSIDLLLLLREKTQGNRSERETQIIEGLIYDLQLRYVAATKPKP